MSDQKQMVNIEKKSAMGTSNGRIFGQGRERGFGMSKHKPRNQKKKSRRKNKRN